MKFPDHIRDRVKKEIDVLIADNEGFPVDGIVDKVLEAITPADMRAIGGTMYMYKKGAYDERGKVVAFIKDQGMMFEIGDLFRGYHWSSGSDPAEGM